MSRQAAIDALYSACFGNLRNTEHGHDLIAKAVDALIETVREGCAEGSSDRVTLRDMLAASVLNSAYTGLSTFEDMASDAYTLADIMLAERAKVKP